MELGGVLGTPLYLFSKGEKNSVVHKGEMSDKLLSMHCQQFQRGRLLSTMQQCFHYYQHDGVCRIKVQGCHYH